MRITADKESAMNKHLKMSNGPIDLNLLLNVLITPIVLPKRPMLVTHMKYARNAKLLFSKFIF